MTSPKMHQLYICKRRIIEVWGTMWFFSTEMWKHIGHEHGIRIPWLYCIHKFHYNLFPPFLLTCDIISRNVIYERKSWKNKRKQWWTRQDTIFKIQRILAADELSCSIWNKWKENRLSSNLHFFFKSSIHISLGNSLQMIYRICEIQL